MLPEWGKLLVSNINYEHEWAEEAEAASGKLATCNGHSLTRSTGCHVNWECFAYNTSKFQSTKERDRERRIMVSMVVVVVAVSLAVATAFTIAPWEKKHTHTHKGRQFASRRANQQITWSPVNQCEYKCKWLNPKLRPLNWSLTFVGDCSCSVGGDFRLKQRRVSFNWVAKLTFQFSLGELVLGKPFEFSSKTRSFCYTNLALTYAIHSCKVKHSTDPSLSSKYSLVSDIWFLAWKILAFQIEQRCVARPKSSSSSS